MMRRLLFIVAVVYSSTFCIAQTLRSQSPPSWDCTLNDGEFNSEEGGCLHFETGLVWSSPPQTPTSFKNALTYCETLVHGQWKDWQLPSFSELITVAGREKSYQHLSGNLVDFFWSSNTQKNQSHYKMVLLASGEFSSQKASSLGGTICIRRPPDIDEDHVPDSSDKCNLTPKDSREKVWTTGEYKGCIGGEYYASLEKARALKEQAQRIAEEALRISCLEEGASFRSTEQGCKDFESGLTWSAASSTTMNRPQAHNYCKRLAQGVGDHAKYGWRLPTYKELFDISGPSLALRYLRLGQSKLFWSSSRTTSRRNPGNQVFEWRVTEHGWAVNIKTGATAKEAIHSHIEWSRFGLPSNSFKNIPSKMPASVICVR